MDDAQQFQEIMANYGGKPGKPSRRLLALLRDNGVADQAIEYLAGYVLKKSSGVNAIYLYSLKDLFEMNSEEGVPIAIRDGLLIVGSCPNGDPVAVDVRESLGAAGYIGHETMWQGSNVRDVFKVLAPGLGALAAGLDSDAFPLDYYFYCNRSSSLDPGSHTRAGQRVDRRRSQSSVSNSPCSQKRYTDSSLAKVTTLTTGAGSRLVG